MHTILMLCSRQKACRQCGKNFTPARSMQSVCSLSCAIASSREKAIIEAGKAQAKRDRERKIEYTPRSKLIAAAETAVRLYCRVRDAADPCISCGRTVAEVEAGGYKVGGHWDGGHYISKGSHPEIRMVTWNIHKQCKSCNGGSGKYTGKRDTVQQAYRVNLVNKIGPERVEWLEGHHPIKQYEAVDLRRIRKIFTRRAKHLARLRNG